MPSASAAGRIRGGGRDDGPWPGGRCGGGDAGVEGAERGVAAVRAEGIEPAAGSGGQAGDGPGTPLLRIANPSHSIKRKRAI